MTIWEICIRRPVFTAMLVSAPIVLGLASYARLGVELFPNVDVPIVTITTTLRGAGVEEMETSVTKVIEEAVNTVSGIDELRSTTREGQSQLVVSFLLEKNGNVAAQEVDAKVRTVLGQLPVGTDAPIIDKIAIDAAPVMTLAVSGRRDLREVTEIAKKKIKEDLETLNGVGSVVLVGGRQRAIHIVLDTDKLLKYENLTVEDVRQALPPREPRRPGRQGRSPPVGAGIAHAGSGGKARGFRPAHHRQSQRPACSRRRCWPGRGLGRGIARRQPPVGQRCLGG